MVWGNVTFCVLCTNVVLFLTSIPQCGVLHASTRGGLEPDTESELYVVGSGDFSVCDFVSAVKTRYWFG